MGHIRSTMISTPDLAEFDSEVRVIYETLLDFLKPKSPLSESLSSPAAFQPEFQDRAVSPISSIISELSSLHDEDVSQTSCSSLRASLTSKTLFIQVS